MKLLIVTYGLNTVGGVQSWQHLFAHGLTTKKHEVSIMEMYDYSETHPDKKFERCWDPAIKIIKLNGPIVQRGVNPKTTLAAIKVVLNIRQKLKLGRFLDREKFDAILFPDPNFTFFFFKRTLKANNCFVQFHSSFARFKSTSKLRYILTKKLHTVYQKFIFLSHGDMLQAISNGFCRPRLGYMYNFINDSKFTKYDGQQIIRKKQILIVGNLDNPDKQIDHVLMAISKINTAVLGDWKIKIIGDGENKEKLRNLARTLEIDNRVEFAGKKNNPALDFFESSFFVLSSAFEGAPLTLLECIFANLPIISYDCSPFISEIIVNKQYGCIVDKNNIVKLSEAIENFIIDPALLSRISLQLDELKSKHSMQSSIEKWELLLSSNRQT
ncbi:MAG: glycosyltransferase [Flavobacterium sp.]|nr:MAG: glycosyltransferase [Flavobacterium sp.]